MCFHRALQLLRHLGDLLVFKLKAALVGDETGADRQELFQHFQVIFTDRAARLYNIHDDVRKSQNRRQLNASV